MAWIVLVDGRVHRDLKKAPRHVLLAIGPMLEELAADPLRRRPGLDIKMLHGRGPTGRVRLGSWRALVDPDARIVRVRPRGSAYQ